MAIQKLNALLYWVPAIATTSKCIAQRNYFLESSAIWISPIHPYFTVLVYYNVS